MEKEKIDEVVQRYLHSNNEDFVKDFVSISNFLESNNVKNGKVVDDVVNHYINKTKTNGKKIRTITPNVNDDIMMIGDGILKQWIYAFSTDERKLQLNTFYELYHNSNLSTKACLIQLKQQFHIKLIQTMNARGEKVTKEDLQTSSTKNEEIGYLNEEIGRLINSATSVEMLVEEFEKGFARLTKEIKNDITLEKRQWKPIRNQYIDKYYQLLDKLQRKNEDWHSKPEKYTVYGGNEVFRKHILNQLLKLQDNYSIDGVLNVFNEACEILKYRISVYITYWGMEDVFTKKLSIMGELMEANADLNSFLKVMETI